MPDEMTFTLTPPPNFYLVTASEETETFRQRLETEGRQPLALFKPVDKDWGTSAVAMMVTSDDPPMPEGQFAEWAARESLAIDERKGEEFELGDFQAPPGSEIQFDASNAVATSLGVLSQGPRFVTMGILTTGLRCSKCPDVRDLFKADLARLLGVPDPNGFDLIGYELDGILHLRGRVVALRMDGAARSPQEGEEMLATMETWVHALLRNNP